MQRHYRLRRNSDFQLIWQQGEFFSSTLMVLGFRENNLDNSRFGFVVSKKLGKAVQRNKIKRRMREAVRLRLEQIKPGYDLILIARQPINRASYPEIEQALNYLLRKSGLLRAGSASDGCKD
jgi:ribonuclease P protein component